MRSSKLAAALALLAIAIAAMPGGEGAPTLCPHTIHISQATHTQLVTAGPDQRIFICGLIVVSAGPQSISLVEGTGTTCDTDTQGLIGSHSASMSLAPNAGFAGVASSPWLNTRVASDHLCLFQSGTANVSGTLTYEVAQ